LECGEGVIDASNGGFVGVDVEIANSMADELEKVSFAGKQLVKEWLTVAGSSSRSMTAR